MGLLQEHGNALVKHLKHPAEQIDVPIPGSTSDPSIRAQRIPQITLAPGLICSSSNRRHASRPESRYIGVAEIGRDRVSDYPFPKGTSLEEAERWLAPNLSYDPEE